MHWGLELLSHLMPSTSSKHHFIGRGHSLANAINTTKKETEKSKQKNSVIANLMANLVVV